LPAPDPAEDLALLVEAARAAGELASQYAGPTPVLHEKTGGQGPVTEADLAVDRLLHQRLTEARPDYGWLSEETLDGPGRLARRRVFIVDPIDGTRAFADGLDSWVHSLAIVEARAVIAAVIYLPLKSKLYAASLGGGATLNGAPIHPTAQAAAEGARVLAARPVMEAMHWRGEVPAFERHHRPSLAWRLSLVAEGAFDAMLTLRPSWEWDIAAGALILAEAGARVTDRQGKPLKFNNPHPQVNGVLAAGPALHRVLLRALRQPEDAPRLV
jgi:myo-inositol-1(or 4)-monophosphatase